MNTTIKSIIPAVTFLVLGMLLFTILPVITLPPIMGSKFSFGLSACVILFWFSLAFLRFEKIPITKVQLQPDKDSLKRLAMGFLIGAIISGTMLATLFALTDLTFEQTDSATWVKFLLASLVFIPLALMEEILFRGYPFFRLAQLINVRWVILITATLFAVYHYNGNNDIWSLLIGPGIWGVTFAVAAYLSKSIAVPLGIHIAANLIQAVYGLKPNFSSIWTVREVAQSSFGINSETLGISMQIILLVVTVIVFEIGHKQRNLDQV